jgi:hypothetical protein
VDLHFLLVTLLLEMERSLVARCPCQVANGVYKSDAECRRAVNLGQSWVDCVNQRDLSAYEEPELHEPLRCNIAELVQRSECLMGSPCSDDAVAACMMQNLGCPELPYQLLSEVVVECGVALSR